MHYRLQTYFFESFKIVGTSGYLKNNLKYDFFGSSIVQKPLVKFFSISKSFALKFNFSVYCMLKWIWKYKVPNKNGPNIVLDIKIWSS